MVEETKPTNGGAEPTPDEKLVWTKKELKWQIRSLENQIFAAQKQHGDIKEVLVILKSAIQNFSEDKFTDAEKYVIDVKEKLVEIIHSLNGWMSWRKYAYFASVWGLSPIVTAILSMSISFILIHSLPSGSILGLGVPLWGPFVAVIGSSVQILIGVVKDYKDDGMISQYKRLWYLVIPFASFAFGFIAILLIQVGLINITLGQASLNQTVNISNLTQIAKGEQPIEPTAYPIIICFLAGYATDWFIGLLGKLTYTGEAEK